MILVEMHFPTSGTCPDETHFRHLEKWVRSSRQPGQGGGLFFFFFFFFFFFVLRLNVPVNNFSVMSGRSQRFLGLTSTVGSRCALLKDTTR